MKIDNSTTTPSPAAFHDAYAAHYDDEVRVYECYLAEVLFGLCFEYVKLPRMARTYSIITPLTSKASSAPPGTNGGRRSGASSAKIYLSPGRYKSEGSDT